MAITNFLDSYVEYSKNTVAIPPLFHKWCGHLAISSMLGKRLWIDRGHFKIYPNLYVMLMGEPGTGKGIACSLLQGILEEAGYEYFAADKSSKEMFLQDLADGISFNGTGSLDSLLSNTKFGKDGDAGSTEPRECFILAEEFGDFLGQNNFDFIKFLTKVWSSDQPYRYRIKTGRSVTITDPYINLLGGTTSSDFATTFPPQITSQGFMARLILVSGEFIGERVTWPDGLDTGMKSELAYYLQSVKGTYDGNLLIPDDTSRYLDRINQGFTGLSDPRFKDYNNRRFTQLLKLSIINAASRLDRSVSSEDVRRSDDLLRETEQWMPKAIGSFGKAKNADVSNKVMQMLYTATKPMNMREIWKVVCDDLEKYEDLGNILQKLATSDRVQTVSGGWLPKLAPKEEGTKHES